MDFWFGDSKASQGPYVFFLLKLEKIMECVGGVLPDGLGTAVREAADLRLTYHRASEEMGPEASV